MPETTSGLISLHAREGQADFLGLPWALPLARWGERCGDLVQVERGLSRHEVIFLQLGSVLYAFKELPDGAAEREYDRLRWLEERRLPVVFPAGHARTRAAGEEEPTSVLVTRFLEDSLPFRTLFMNPGMERYRERLMDAMAGLIVRLHLAGFYWGDCSLSNTLFRRDAGELQAYLVDAETSETHESLSDGRRAQDLEILEENCAGELADLRVVVELPATLPVYETGTLIRQRVERLWDEITRVEILSPGESYRIHERIRALNALGFSVGEVELETTGDGNRLRMRTIVTDRDYHRHHLHSLTGLVAGERQAALMFNEIREIRALLARSSDRSVSLSVAAHRWLRERWEPAMASLQPLIGRRGEAAELYAEVLEHKWFMSERAHGDVGLDRAITDYLERFRGR